MRSLQSQETTDCVPCLATDSRRAPSWRTAPCSGPLPRPARHRQASQGRWLCLSKKLYLCPIKGT